MNGIRYISNEFLLARTEKASLWYRKGKVTVRKTDGSTVAHQLHKGWRTLRLAERMLRLSPRTGVGLDNGDFLFSDHGKIRCLKYPDYALSTEHAFSRGMNNPLTFCVRRDETGKIADILYGEYIWNSDHGPVSIYRRENGDWREVYAFPAGAITHIHNIVHDRFLNRYLIMTGDGDAESGIWEADYEFREVRPVKTGSQAYRACVMLPTADGIYYATDTPLEQNSVCRISGDHEAEKIAEIAGPVIFGTERNGDLYFATSVEGDSRLKKWSYRLSYRLGTGVKDRYSHLYRLSTDGTVKELGKIKKDILPMWLFEFGNMKFSSTDDGRVYICPQSLRGRNGTYVLDNE